MKEILIFDLSSIHSKALKYNLNKNFNVQVISNLKRYELERFDDFHAILIILNNWSETKYVDFFRKKSKNIIIAFDEKINDCYKIKPSSHIINLSMSVSKYDFVNDVKKVLKNL